MATIQPRREASATAQDTASSHPYTCNTCQVAFRNSDLQKGHMRSDWHRYNLKRRVASLPAISSEIFTDKVLQSRASANAEADRAGFHRECKVCHRTYFSENSYNNHIASQNHKAKAAAADRVQNARPVQIDDASSVMSSTFSLGESIPVSKADTDSEAEEEFSHIVEGMKKTDLKERLSPIKRPSNPSLSAALEKDPAVATLAEQTPSSATPTPSTANASVVTTLTTKSCLFCNYESPTASLSVTHMERIHGMFIPEKQYLVDLEGLLSSLQQRIQEYHECLSCGKAKVSAFAAQLHMRDKGHCQIPYSTEQEQLEIGDFYDFRSTYSDPEGSDDEDESMDDAEGKANGGAKLGGKRESKTVDADGNEAEAGGEDGWETDSSASSLDSADLAAVPMEHREHSYQRLSKHAHHSKNDTRPHHQRDGWHSHTHSHKPTHAAFYDDYELHLPNGKSVGHRSLNKYYRQNLYRYPTTQEKEEGKERLAIKHSAEDSDLDSDLDSDVDMDNDGDDDVTINNDNTVATRNNTSTSGHDRAVVKRGELGMTGVSDIKKREVKKAEKRGRAAQDAGQRRMQWLVNREANNQKHYRDPMLQ